MNEILLIGSLIFIYGMALLGYKLFGKTGLYCISAAATILANIEVLIMIKAFGAEQTLGNVLFAVTFLITDILSECEGKKAADKAVYTSFLPRYSSSCSVRAGCTTFRAKATGHRPQYGLSSQTRRE